MADITGISDARADRYMGHADGRVGRRYTHALRGQLAEDARRLDAYLARGAAEVVRLARLRERTGRMLAATDLGRS